jgi:hypothetical protein
MSWFVPAVPAWDPAWALMVVSYSFNQSTNELFVTPAKKSAMPPWAAVTRGLILDGLPHQTT